MEYADALKVIDSSEQKGFMVHFEHKEGIMLRSDYFPDKVIGEKLIESEEEAWELAKKFASKTKKRCVNLYVVDDRFSPVDGYVAKKISNR